MAKQILQFEPIHSMQGFTARYRHNYRTYDVPNADREKEWMNREIIGLPPGETYNSLFEKRVLSLPYYQTHKIGKGRTLGFEFMMSYGRKGLPDNFDVDKWAEKSAEFIADWFGRENVASVVLHMDENQPHLHAVVIPVSEGKLRAKAFINDRQDARNLHKKYHEYTKECGLEAENSYVQIDHQKTAFFYANLDKELEKKLPEPRKDEALDRYYARVNAFYQEQLMRALDRETKMEQYKNEKEALEKANRAIEQKTAAKYRKEIKEIMDVIGTTANAAHAIKYRDHLLKAIEHTRESNPELAGSVEQIISNMQRNYEKAVYEEEQETNQK